MSIKTIIISQLQQIAEENGQTKELPPLTDDLILTESGLDSLAIAVLVTRLEDKLGVDPFADFTSSSFPVTLGDFVRLYESVEIRCVSAAGQDR